jgi:uncharacterized repeat protein (TIGR01451 family)
MKKKNNFEGMINHVSFVLVLATFSFSTAFAKDVMLKYSGYRISATVSTKEYNAGDVVSFAAGTLDTLSKKKTKIQFGVLFREPQKNFSKVIVAELFDAASNTSLRKISLEELLGKESQSWKVTEQSNDTGSIRTFRFTAARKDFSLTRSVNAIMNKDIPTGKMMEERWTLECAANVSVRLVLYGRIEGMAVHTGSTMQISPNTSGISFEPSIIINYGEPASLNLKKSLKKDAPSTFTVTTNKITLTSGQQSELLVISVYGTSTVFKKYIAQQSKIIQDYVQTHRTAPELAAVTVTDKKSAAPGDTITYTIIYHNIGTAPAADIVITNPIPANMLYVENSARGEGSDITVEREPVALPKMGIVKSLSWNFKNAIYPGEERSVSYKVVLQ